MKVPSSYGFEEHTASISYDERQRETRRRAGDELATSSDQSSDGCRDDEWRTADSNA